MNETLRKLTIDGDDIEPTSNDSFDLDDLLHPAQAFSHPSDVVNDPDLTLNEKRAILASWASDACAIESDPPYDVRPRKVASRSRSTTSWTHFARWTPGRRKPATATAASCASAGFSAAAAARAVTGNLFTRRLH